MLLWFIFFFFKQKTAYEMRISDWSSDVCSSDLLGYSAEALGGWADRARLMSSGEVPADLATVAYPPAERTGRDVFLYVISGFKARNPASAVALIERLGSPPAPRRGTRISGDGGPKDGRPALRRQSGHIDRSSGRENDWT